MFVVSFEPTDDIKKIYEIKQILNSSVKVEPIKPSKLIPQCKSCQNFGHTKNYCNKPQRCVKCAGKHATKDYSKPDDIPPKCCNCGKSHPPSYRGCLVAKELQKIRDKNKQTRNHNVNYSDKPLRENIGLQQQAANGYSNQNKSKSYAAIVKESSQTSKKTGEDMLSRIFNKLEEQEKFNRMLLDRLERLENCTCVNRRNFS